MSNLLRNPAQTAQAKKQIAETLSLSNPNPTQTFKPHTMNAHATRTVNQVTNPALAESTAPEIVKRTIEQALRLLAVAGTEYIIRLSDGTTITQGSLELVAAKPPKQAKKKRSLKMPYGSMRNAVLPFIECLKVGDVAELGLTPEMIAADVNMHDLLSTVSNAAAKCFGNGSHKVCTNHKTGKVEILRTA